MYTTLSNRKLWFDGNSTVHPSSILELIQQGVSPVNLCVDYLTDDIKQYNQFCNKDETIEVKKENKPLSFDWNIPSPYDNMDIVTLLQQKKQQYCIDNNITDSLIVSTIDTRINEEMRLYKKNDKIDVLRAMVYIVDTLTLNKIIWGVGRGSSVSSFVLYLLGVHDVDCIKYRLDMSDFLS